MDLLVVSIIVSFIRSFLISKLRNSSGFGGTCVNGKCQSAGAIDTAKVLLSLDIMKVLFILCADD